MIVFRFWDISKKVNYFNHVNYLKVTEMNIENWAHDENVFLKADRALSKLKFLFYLKFKYFSNFKKMYFTSTIVVINNIAY